MTQTAAQQDATARYKARQIAKGMCRDCRTTLAEPDRVRCARCAEKHNAANRVRPKPKAKPRPPKSKKLKPSNGPSRQLAHKHKRIAEGYCRRCLKNRAEPGKSRCAGCIEAKR